MLCRESLQQALRVVRATLECQFILPFWDEPALEFDECYVPDLSGFKIETGMKGELTMPDGSNLRLSLLPVMERLQAKLLSEAEDDTTSCCTLLEVK